MGGAVRFLLLGVCCCLVASVVPGSALGGRPAEPSFALAQGLAAAPSEVWHPNSVSLTVFGNVSLADLSLPGLAVVLGLADGFNPCAMWALVYLLSLLVTLQERKKIWLLVGSFVLASGVLYFLFMTAWLNVFLFIGFLRPVTIVIGCTALVVGVLDLRSFVMTRGAPVCAVGNPGFKQRTMDRMERLVAAPVSLASLLGVIALAFTVNTIEFACSAGLPAVFTHTLSLRPLSAFQYYGYILLYDFFFMLDDLIIFSLAAFACETTLGSGYAKYGKLLGGVVLSGLGLVMLLAPEMLR
ncbi:hypothetical protein [Thiovibrio frasassiensis]|jgi:hypothetical protein|uniref:Glutaredoxin n=1 Tax=Thiovibrio frasassiensis TaxID=2984131 RepID=A0A9X4ME83_9BACT|nr:hypothetical protein [Thiovibrio frasassiensis]MDG4474671.1 hypothetical protein [Thiovibrio frasassiensis]